MRKKSLIILAAVLVAFTLSVPVLAADGQSRGFFDTLADIGMTISTAALRGLASFTR